MTGTITRVQRDRGTGSLLGDDAKTYSFGRNDLRDVWFHELTEAAPITFEPGKNLSATRVRPVRASALIRP
jgi:hypothetical protein